MPEIKHFTNDDLMRYLQLIDMQSNVDSNGQIFVAFEVDENLPYNVVFWFSPCDGDGWFDIDAVADGFDIPEGRMSQALEIANDLSSRARIPKIFIKNGRFHVEQSMKFPVNTDDDFMAGYIDTVLMMTCEFFIEVFNKLW